jgi:predicted 3-demethylubiquinone-9 3-methyltransferase (glyoxalase superfamily)
MEELDHYTTPGVMIGSGAPIQEPPLTPALHPAERNWRSMQKITTFLTFIGQAEEAMNFYVSLFDRSEVLSIERYGPNEAGTEGSVKRARYSLGGQEFMCIDSPPVHEWTFTPAVSLFVSCRSEEEIDHLHALLSEGGQVFMPLTAYPFSERFAWLADKYGVSWQLSLESG